jgi:protein-L-isoaspartate(D-aspartate) O-methyltransferase
MEEHEDRFLFARWRMVEKDLKGKGIKDERVLGAMGQVPREEFLPEWYAEKAYEDGPLPIGMGQTISQPYIVALMTQELDVKEGCDVLEIGTGCGYQTAVLSRLAKKVYTAERFSTLSEAAQAVLARLGIRNVQFYVGDGSQGWYEKRTFERVMITAAVPEMPGPVVEQLAEGGIIVAPVGGEMMQNLVLGRKRRGELITEVVCGCRFVRLVGEYGFDE